MWLLKNITWKMNKSLGKHLGNDLNLKGVPNVSCFFNFLRELGNDLNLKGVPNPVPYSQREQTLGMVTI